MISAMTTPALLLLAGTLCYSVMAAVLLRYRRAPGAAVTAFAMGGCLVWVAGGLANSLTTQLPLQLLAMKISYIGSCVTPVAILVFVAFYTRARPIEWRIAGRLLVIPAISLILVWTNPVHELMWAHPPAGEDGAFSVHPDWGLWFRWIHLPYLWTLVLIALAYLLRTVVRGAPVVARAGHRITRGQAAVLFIAITFTFVVNVFTVVGPDDFPASPTAVAIALISFCFLWLFTQIEIVPVRYVAHRRILSTMPDPVIVLDARDRVLDLNPQAAQLVSTDAPAGRHAQELLAQEPSLLALLPREGEVLEELSLTSGRYYEARISPFHDARGTVRGRTLLLRDITERYLHDRRLRSIVAVSPNGIVQLQADLDEQGRVVDAICIFANASAATYLGVEHATMPGGRMLEAMPAVGPQMLGVFQRAIDKGEDQQVDIPVAGEAEDPLWFRAIVSPVDEELTITFMEVTAEKRREAEMHQVAFLDPLTHALNRRGLEQAFNELPVQGRRGHGSHAVLFMDLDRFKIVNDTYGHSVGDRLLKEFAARLKSAIREGDLMARVGGDEFVVVLVDSDKETTATTVQRLMQVTEAPYWLSERAVSCRPSIGIAHVAEPEVTFAQALIEADHAMYRAKESGAGGTLANATKLATKA